MTTNNAQLYQSISLLMAREQLYTNAHVTGSDLACRLHTSERCLDDAIFCGTGGLSFEQFVNSYRLVLATHLLSVTSDSVETIACTCGFLDKPTFCRIFFDEYGMSPHEYRHTLK